MGQGDFGPDGEFNFGGIGNKRRFTKMQALYGDDWDDSLEPQKAGKQFKHSFSGNALQGMSFVKSKTVLGDSSLVDEDRSMPEKQASVKLP